MKKINICFDARNLKERFRTGIWFVSANILKELYSLDKVNLSLYLPLEEISLKEYILETLKIENILILNEKDNFLKIDIFISIMYKVPDFIHKYPNISCYTILHDVTPLLFPENFAANIQHLSNHWFILLIC